MPSRLTARLAALPQPADPHLLRAHVGGDPSAFPEIVRRYAGLAMRVAVDVCPSTADDVAQATMALLGRKAAAVATRESIAGWVFETARRLALKSRTAAARRAKHESRAARPTPPTNPLDTLTFREVRAAVAEELARLPDELQAPLVLCYWDGLTGAAAAARLGCSVSTLKRRLDVGRERLSARLIRRGFAGASVLAALTGLQAMGRATAPVTLIRSAVKGADGISPGAAALLKPGSTRGLTVLFAFAAVTLSALVLGLTSTSTEAGNQVPPPASKAPETATVPGPPMDAFGDALPPGAIARLGSVRFRTADFPKIISVSPDGKWLVSATGHLDSRFAIWEADTGRLVREVAPPDYPKPEAIQWLPDGRGLAAYKVAAKDYVIWEFTDPEARPPVADQSNSSTLGTFEASAFSPDGSLLAGGERAGPEGTAGKLQVWAVRPGRPVRETEPRFVLEKPDGFVALAFTPDGKRLVGMIQGRQPNRMPKGPAGPIEPGEAADKARVFVWDAVTGKERLAFDVPAAEWGRFHHTRDMVPHAISPDGKTLFIAPQGGHVQALDLETGKRRFDAVALGPLEGAAKKAWPERKSQVSELAVTPDGKTLVAAETTGRTVGLDAATGAVLWRGGRDLDAIYGLAVFPDSKRFALGHGNRHIAVYDVATGKLRVEPAGHRGGMSTVWINPDGKTAMTAGWDSALIRWDLTTGRQLGQVKAAAELARVASFSPDGRRAIGNQGLMDTTTAKVLVPLELPHLGYIGLERRAAWLPDGSVVAADQENLAVRYAADGKKITEYVLAKPGKPRTGPPVACVAVSPDGKTVVLCGEGATPPAPEGAITLRSDKGWVAVFDANTGAKLREWESKGTGAAAGFTGAAFLPDGSKVVLSRWVHQASYRPDQPDPMLDLTAGLVLFDPATGEHISPFDAPKPGPRGDRLVNSVTVSPTGTQMAAVEWDKSLTVYETASGGIRRRLDGHRASIGQAAFTPVGTRLVTVSDDGTGLVWDVTPARPVSPVALNDADRQKRWATLLTANAEAAYRAMGELASDPAGTVAFLTAHLKATPAPTDADLNRLIAGLGAPAFADREAAARDLDTLGGLAVAPIRTRSSAVKSAEVRQRLDDFLKRHDRPGRTTGARLREIRAVELLEVIATPDAKALLTQLGEGDSPLARTAATAAKRLDGK